MTLRGLVYRLVFEERLPNKPTAVERQAARPDLDERVERVAQRLDEEVGPAVALIEPTRHGSLGAVFDHVGIAVSDLAASERFYRTVLSVLGVEPSHADAALVEWEDWAIGPTDREHPVTRGLHVGFRAPSRAAVDAFWQAGIDAGYRDDGAPGPRTKYGPDY
jgi:catechol-2,3-dioxygenase